MSRLTINQHWFMQWLGVEQATSGRRQAIVWTNANPVSRGTMSWYAEMRTMSQCFWGINLDIYCENILSRNFGGQNSIEIHIGPGNGLAHVRNHAIIRINTGIMLILQSEIHFFGIWIKIERSQWNAFVMLSTILWSIFRAQYISTHRVWVTYIRVGCVVDHWFK